jgi:hypothetical protein
MIMSPISSNSLLRPVAPAKRRRRTLKGWKKAEKKIEKQPGVPPEGIRFLPYFFRSSVTSASVRGLVGNEKANPLPNDCRRCDFSLYSASAKNKRKIRLSSWTFSSFGEDSPPRDFPSFPSNYPLNNS